MRIERTESVTGGPNRTPREEIVPIYTENDLVEIDLAFDCSESESWPLDSGLVVWPVQIEAMRQLIAASEYLDSQAKSEQAGGSDERGGLYAAGFNHELIKVGVWTNYDLLYVEDREEDDSGDLNTSNFDRKINALRTRNGERLPSGGTTVTPAINYLDSHYLGEFKKDKNGQLVPTTKRPRRGRALFTDGAMTDRKEFGKRLEYSSDEWPSEDWFVAILGEGSSHDATLKCYQKIAEEYRNVHVYSFDKVSNPAEIAEDMAFALLPHSA